MFLHNTFILSFFNLENNLKKVILLNYFNQTTLLGKWYSVLNKNTIVISIIENNVEVLIPISISNSIMNQVINFCSIGRFQALKEKY